MRFDSQLHARHYSLVMRPLKIALVAGEASGDILGAGLMSALKQQTQAPIEFVGVGGPLMEEQGLTSYFPMERLAVMGLVEILGRIRELTRRRKQLIKDLLAERPDVFIGIDSPDFTLEIELQLRQQGIKTVHYVSPSVWAWRQKRVFKIKQACDLMLTLLPFEAQFYHAHQVPVKFVGHPLADTIALTHDSQAAKQALGLSLEQPVIALLPGSRGGEVGKLAPLFIQTAEYLAQQQPNLQFVLPAANAARYEQISALLEARSQAQANIQLVQGQSQRVLQASDAVLIASGTATLETMLFKKPMVVAYKLAPLTFAILKRLVKTPYIALPNLLANQALVPEFIQQQATPEHLAKALQQVLAQPEQQTQHFMQLHQGLRKDASNQAAKAVLELL